MRDLVALIVVSLIAGCLVVLQPSSAQALSSANLVESRLPSAERFDLQPARLAVNPQQVVTATVAPTLSLSAPIGLISPTIPFSLTVVVGTPVTTVVENSPQATITTTEPSTTTVVATSTISADSPAISTTQSISGLVATEQAPTSTAEPEPTPTPESTVDPSELDAAYAGALEGAIVANRTDSDVTFFVDGVTYALAPRRSLGIELTRPTTVMSLYTCDANSPASEDICFWDPYLMEQDGFYEVVNGAEAGPPVSLVLQAAGAPPSNQVWIQNRTGERELLVYDSETYEVPPSAVQEFVLPGDAPALVHMRSCVAVSGDSRCEWTPRSVEPGIYYGLVEVVTAGGVPNSVVTTLELRPVITDEGTAAEGPPQLLCRLQVPAVNVRSGPGLQYLIIAKVRGAENEPASVLVTGKDETGQWLTVDQRVADGGWVTGSTSFILCDGDIASLPVTEITDGRLAVDVAEPVVQTSDDQAQADPDPAVPAATETTATEAAPDDAASAESSSDEGAATENSAVPDGLALLTVFNTFEGDVRFTLDQKFRVKEGPSEFDLQSGDVVEVLVFPGVIRFSVGSNWRAENLSGNAEFTIEPDEVHSIWLKFVPDPDGSGFDMQYQWP